MKKQRRKNKKISREMTMVLMLNAFVIGMVVEKIATSGLSWVSTIGYLRQEE